MKELLNDKMLLDYFAGQALHSLLVQSNLPRYGKPEKPGETIPAAELASDAYVVAAAMVA